MSIKSLDTVRNLPALITQIMGNPTYLNDLTAELDRHKGPFSKKHLLTITLWKLNRYPRLTPVTIRQLNDLKRRYSKRKAEECLRALLNTHGVGLAMSSTYLRFLLPQRFAIIDQRAYRVLYGKAMPTKHRIDDLTTLYFTYLQDLKEKSLAKGIPFHLADRILYDIDRRVNKSNNLQNY